MKVVAAGFNIEWPAGWRLPNKGESIVLYGQRYNVVGVEFHPRHTAGPGQSGGWGTPPPVNESVVVLETEIPAEWEPQAGHLTGTEEVLG